MYYVRQRTNWNIWITLSAVDYAAIHPGGEEIGYNEQSWMDTVHASKDNPGNGLVRLFLGNRRVSETESVDRLRYMVERGADLKRRLIGGNTPLMLAIKDQSR